MNCKEAVRGAGDNEIQVEYHLCCQQILSGSLASWYKHMHTTTSTTIPPPAITTHLEELVTFGLRDLAYINSF